MNNKRKQARKIAAAVVALSLMLSSPAFAAEAPPKQEAGADTPAKSAADSGQVTGSDASALFKDVSPQHWAIKHITKLSALGIIEGYEKGEYRPEASVSQQDVLIMAIRMMGLEDEVLKSKTETVLPFTVDNYAKPYVAYAFDVGLITTNEETESTGVTAKTAWGSRPATREWVAKLVIRVINKQDLAEKEASTPSAFKDAKDFSDWAVGFVNAAVSLKIVDGVDDNNFQPKGAVTRAQMATFLSRADKELTTRSNKVATGYVLELRDEKLTIQNEQGHSQAFTLTPTTVIYHGRDDSRIPSSTLKETHEVYIIAKQGTATYIELTNDEEKMGSIEGTLKDLYLNNMQIAVTQGNGVELKELAPNVTVTDKDGRGLSIGSIPPASIIELKWSLLKPEAKISQIIVKQMPVSKTAEGTVDSIQKDQNSVTFVEQSSGQKETYTLAALVPVSLPDGAASDISKLRVGDVVTYEVKANQLVNLTLRKQADVNATVEGTLMSISDDKKSMTININGKSLGAYFIADNAIVEIDGLSNAGFFDLEIGDQLKLELLNEKIVHAAVTNRSIKQMTFATISVYDPDTQLLAGTYENGETFAFKLTEDTALKEGETTVPLKNFSAKFEKGDKIDLTVSKDKVITLALTKRVEGTLTQVNSTSDEVSIRTASGQNITFDVDEGVPVSVWGKDNATLSDLQVGDIVVAELNGSQDELMNISPTKTAVYKTLAANADTRQVSAKDENGGLFTFKVDLSDKISSPGKSAAKFDDIVQDEYIKVTYVGNTVDKIVLLNSVRGKLTGIDTAAGTVTVEDYNNGVQVVPVGEQFVIKHNGNASAALTNLKPNDRVEIIKDAGDKTTISVATPSKRTVSSYDTLLNQLVFKATASDDKTAFNFFPKAYLHKGTETVTANAFTENEEVTIYVLDGKIVEIEK
ncbi:S-layer homology domain-containing protein [Paenibacillus xerothermodurans]|uniref:S-layer homology domain-containing protein n=1 Tax=Paenibacillus xerothermodurans TaxID=1977292 RepID=A0A2W1P2E3_PAEXE|nr:S-layer homology domain-containing protein [Paenibacillus xerothermodurans]PZE21902.1 S-layer homology domain-containing protein [Paenibacillus xerothermodurans]